MLGTRVSLEQDTTLPELAHVAERLSPRRMAAEVGPRFTRLLQRNFRSLGSNKLGWPSTHFWGRAANATNWSIEADVKSVVIACNQIGVRQRLLGGVIKPVNAGALTIPAAPEAYGKTAREFNNLVFGFALNPATGKMQPCLKEAIATSVTFGKKKKDGSQSVKLLSTTTGLHVMFWLCGGVRQNADPKVMPSEEQFNQAMDQSVEALLR